MTCSLNKNSQKATNNWSSLKKIECVTGEYLFAVNAQTTKKGTRYQAPFLPLVKMLLWS